MNIKHGFLSLIFIIIYKLNFILANNVTTTTIATTKETTTLLPFELRVGLYENVYDNTTAIRDAKVLHDAVTGLGTDEDKIIKILTTNSTSQIQDIATAYYNLYQKSLTEDLKDDVSGNFGTLVVGLVEEPYTYIVKELHTALTSSKLDHYAIVQILVTRERDALKRIMDKYQLIFNETLLSSITKHTDGDFREFMTKVITPPLRLPIAPINQTIIQTHKAILPKPNDTTVDKAQLIQLLAKATYEQLRYAVYQFEVEYNMRIEEAIEIHIKDPYLLLALTQVANYTKAEFFYYASEIKKILSEDSIDNKALIRIFVIQKDYMLTDIVNTYKNYYNHKLAQDIAKKTSGDYQKLLVGLVNYALTRYQRNNIRGVK